MTVRVDETSPLPIYAQIVDQIRQAVARGELSPGTQLPTVRQFGVDLQINPNTVARAYAELERAGVILTRRGRGTFVREAPAPPAAEEGRERLAAVIMTALGEAAVLGFSAEELIKEMRDYLRTEGRGTPQ